MDSEVIVHLLARHLGEGIEEALVKAVSQIQGAYSCVLMTEDKLIAIRDPNGFRPLCLGMLNGGYIVASETCALDLVDAQYLRDIEPGEILIIEKKGLQSIKPFRQHKHTFCIFEYIYFARPDSNIFGHNVYGVRKRLGKKLAREYPIEADFAMPFPDSGNYAAIGFSQELGILLEMGVIRNHYVGRTFIEPVQSMRDFGVKVKLNPVRDIIKTLREAGAKEVHMVVSCPPHRYPCYYGIDFSTKGELIACQHTVEEVKNYIGLDSLCYLSIPGMLEATEVHENSFCLACFDGSYPIEPEGDASKLCLEY
jgi:amidophosphoribosyltransferase